MSKDATPHRSGEGQVSFIFTKPDEVVAMVAELAKADCGWTVVAELAKADCGWTVVLTQIS